MSDDYSFVVAFVVYLFNMDIYICIFRCTFRLSIDVSASSFFIMLFTVHVVYFFIVACCFITAAGGRGVFVYFRQPACILFIFTDIIVF